MPTKLLTESASALSKSGGRWKAILAVPGTGSSGKYSEEMLREYGPKALAPGAKAFINHDPKRDPRDMFGTYPDGAVYEDGVGLVGELEVFPHYKELIDAIGLHAALSIYMVGEVDDDGNVTKLLPDRLNGVDLVSYGGLEGSGIVEKLYESALAASPKPPAASAVDSNKQEAGNMDELVKAVEALTTLLTAHISESKAAADKQAVAEADAEAIEADKVKAATDAVESYDEKIAAIDAVEGLLPSQIAALRKDAKEGRDIAESLASATALLAEFKTLAENDEAAGGRILGESKVTSGVEYAGKVFGN